MDTTIFISDCINKINSLREKEFVIFNFKYNIDNTEIESAKKLCNENTVEFKNFKSIIKKKASLDKNKPSNIGKKEYSSTPNIDILEDDIFDSNHGDNNEEDEFKLDFLSLDKEKKIELINDFFQRKNIILDPEEYIKIENIIDNPEVNIKKYINVSKVYQQINKLSFIKKLENGTHIVDLNDTKAKKVKKFFNK
jgi:hypothetical protein